MRINLFFLTSFILLIAQTTFFAQEEALSKGVLYPLEVLEDDFPMKQVPEIKGHKVKINEEALNSLDVCYEARFTPEMIKKAKAYSDLYFKEKVQVFSVVKGLQKLYEEELEKGLGKKALPNCLKYLPMAMAANNRRFVSSSGRVGLWQLTYPVAIKYGLKVTQDIDERRDVKKSTEAAARYLKDLYDLFETHDMALMAFTCGPAAVNKAVIRTDDKRDYASLYTYLPDESRDFILTYTVLLYLCEFEGKDKIPVYEIMNAGETERIVLEERLSMKLVSNELNIKVNQIKAMNPIYRSEYIPASTSYPWIVPAGYKEKFEKEKVKLYATQKELDKPMPVPEYSPPKPKPIPKAKIPKDAKKVIYTVKGGDNLSVIAKQYDVKVSELKGWNKLRSDRIDIGQKLIIYVNGYNPSPQSKPEPKPEPTPSGDWVIYTVKSGDTLWSISRKYNCTSDDIMKWNGINANIDVGQKLKIKK